MSLQMKNNVQHGIFKYLILGYVILFQKQINHHTGNMGCKSSKRKFNKEGKKQKLCKIGLGVGRNDLKLEGNFQLGYHSKINKKYEAVDGIPILPEHGQAEEQEENGRVLSTSVLQS